jgi:hypothetical protein
MTIQLFNSILIMTNALRLNNIINNNSYNFNFFNKNFILKNNYYNTIFSDSIEYHNLRCWNSRCFLNYQLENFNENNMIFSLDFFINKEDINNTFIKIDYLYVNNDFYTIKYNEFLKKTNIILKDTETKLIIKSLIYYIENIAKKENINKIIIDVHNDLERYNYELIGLGFNLNNDIICKLNPYWIQAEKII